MQVLVHDLDGVVAGVRAAAGQHLVQQDAGRVDVDPLVGRGVREDLLGRQVGDGAHDRAAGGGAGGRGCAVGGAEHPDQAEVGDLDQAALGDQHVLRLDVAVDQPGPVGGAEGGEHRLQDVQRGPDGERAAVAQQVAQGAAGHVLHGEENVSAVRALVEDVHHVGVGELGDRLGLADEAGGEALVAGQRGVHHLEDDHPVQPGVGGPVDGGHPAGRDALLDPVPVVEQRADQGVVQCHVHPASLVPGRAAGP